MKLDSTGTGAARRVRRPLLVLAAACAAFALSAPPALAQGKPIRIGVPTAMQLQVGRDTQDAVQMAIDDINAKGGVLGRKLEMVVADETENPETGISAIKKLTADEKVDVLVGGYTSGVTLAQLPHISSAKTIYLGVGAASPAITAKVKADYDNYKYVFRVGPINAAHQARQLTGFISTFVKGELGITKIAIVGENAKWVQDLVPILKKGATDAGADVRVTEFFDTQTSDFSPLFSKVKDSGAQYLVVVLSHASSDIFAKQWYDSRFPMPYGGIDVKSMDGDFCQRIGGKSIGQLAANFAVRAPLTPRTIPFFDEFQKRTSRAPVYTAFGANDAVYIYADAVKRANSTDANAVIKELEKTNYVGIPGIIQFDDTHDVKVGTADFKGPSFLMAQWRDGCKREVIYPKPMRTADFTPPAWLKK
ncbi:ABC transporter substrate-binding protein [Ramlibacter algicola]|uniref:ABC transporter substrate-binding protein n=1 Tax=Ramlibacter algicola TaxID=2795217 RepID=A0A934USF1_9BURK|nr:ABC transporter substrate-binding protein [Ramlibacter algicola]MBK0393806.1 ABC transporter substrate-binding protein [Ramlibacter algicola]